MIVTGPLLKPRVATDGLFWGMATVMVPITLASAIGIAVFVFEAFRRAFERIDFLAAPSTPAAAPPIGASVLDNGEELRSGLLRLPGPFNTTGFPALSLPCGFTGSRLPVGLQLAAAPRREGLLLRVARAFEQSSPGRSPAV